MNQSPLDSPFAIGIRIPIPQIFAHLTRVHEWDDPGWFPKSPSYVRAMGAIHRGEDAPPKRKE